jgi:hypothetical protein
LHDFYPASSACRCAKGTGGSYWINFAGWRPLPPSAADQRHNMFLIAKLVQKGFAFLRQVGGKDLRVTTGIGFPLVPQKR